MFVSSATDDDDDGDAVFGTALSAMLNVSRKFNSINTEFAGTSKSCEIEVAVLVFFATLIIFV